MEEVLERRPEPENNHEVSDQEDQSYEEDKVHEQNNHENHHDEQEHIKGKNFSIILDHS